MSFAFKSRSRVGHQVRAIAGEQIEKALASAQGGGDFDKTVHGLRRRCKKVRGLLRLVQPKFEDFKKENAALRDAANLLGGARDARVMVETLDGLTIAGHSQAAREYLVARAERSEAASKTDNPLGQFAEIFEKIGDRAKEWSFDTNGFDLVGDGLEKTYRQFLRDFEAAEGEQTATAMHEWRKQAKYHWYHVTLLSKSAPDLLAPRAKALDHLGEYLGDHHNLAVLTDVLNAAEQDLGDLGPILVAVAKRQEELGEQAFALGHQLAAEKPGALRKRSESYWSLLPEKG